MRSADDAQLTKPGSAPTSYSHKGKNLGPNSSDHKQFMSNFNSRLRELDQAASTSIAPAAFDPTTVPKSEQVTPVPHLKVELSSTQAN